MTIPSQMDFTKAEIHKRCEAALQLAGVAGVFPTPLEDVLRVASVDEVIDITDLPADISARKPRLMQRILGAIVFRSRTVFVDVSQPDGRKRWTVAHEAAHGLLPWHEAAARLDDAHRLFRESAEELELEANIGAAYLMFQGSRWMEEALGYRHSLDVPIALAPKAGASIHPAIRYYVENHPNPMGLIVTGRIRRRNGAVPVYVRASSAAWRERFVDLDVLIGSELFITGSALAALVTEARASNDISRVSLRFTDLTLKATPLDARVTIEVFDNQYNHFFMLRPAHRLELGRRVTARTMSA